MQHQPDKQSDRSTGTAQGATRRDFIKTSALVAGAAAAGSVLPVGGVYAAGSNVIKVGLIGSGNRGSGAALNALHADPSAKLHAMGDMFAAILILGLLGLTADWLVNGLTSRWLSHYLPASEQHVG